MKVIYGIFLSIIGSLSILFSGCFTDCDSEKKGSENLKSEIKTYLPYTNGQKVNFVSAKNNTYEFTIDRVEQVNNLCTKILCKGFNDPFKSLPCEFFEVESITCNFKTSKENFIMSMTAYIDLYEAESTLFYDGLVANFSSDMFFSEGRYGIEPHFTTPAFDRTKLPFAATMVKQEEVSIGGKILKNALIASNGSNRIFLISGKGIAAFEINGEVFFPQ